MQNIQIDAAQSNMNVFTQQILLCYSFKNQTLITNAVGQNVDIMPIILHKQI